MKKFILAVPALLALAAVSCTKSEVLESNDGEIRFNVVANKNSPCTRKAAMARPTSTETRSHRPMAETLG